MMTMRIAITIATMGRLMKNFDMLTAASRRGVGFRIHGGAFASL